MGEVVAFLHFVINSISNVRRPISQGPFFPKHQMDFLRSVMLAPFHFQKSPREKAGCVILRAVRSV